MRKAKSGSIGVVKLFFGILGCGILFIMLIPIAGRLLFIQACSKTPEDVYRIHFTAPIDTVRIIDGDGFTWGGGEHFLKFSSPEPVAVNSGDLFKEIPMESEAARKGIERVSRRFPADRGLFSGSDDIKCLYLRNPDAHSEKWLFSQRSRPLHFFCSYAW